MYKWYWLDSLHATGLSLFSLFSLSVFLIFQLNKIILFFVLWSLLQFVIDSCWKESPHIDVAKFHPPRTWRVEISHSSARVCKMDCQLQGWIHCLVEATNWQDRTTAAWINLHEKMTALPLMTQHWRDVNLIRRGGACEIRSWSFPPWQPIKSTWKQLSLGRSRAPRRE